MLGLEIKQKQLESMKAKRGLWSLSRARLLKDNDEDIQTYLDTTSDGQCENIFAHIKKLHEKLEEKAYKFSPLNLPIYIEQIIGDLVELYLKAFKLMIENMKRKQSQVETSYKSSEVDNQPTKSQQKTHVFDGKGKENAVSEIDLSTWADQSKSVLKESKSPLVSNNLKMIPASEPYVFKRVMPAQTMSFESPSLESEMTMEF